MFAIYVLQTVLQVVLFIRINGLSKVLVPASYLEWSIEKPNWVTDRNLMQQYGYSIFLYQKFNSSLPNYIKSNRGCENSVYYRYVVDHYHDFPDIAIFVHSRPEQHIPKEFSNWLDVLNCISPNATYMSLNFDKKVCREFFNGYWARYAIWLEQCARDVLKLIWDIDEHNSAELNRRVPPQKQLTVCTHCCQQFFVSRAMIHKRPLSVWRRLLEVLGNQTQCHIGEPDYENLYAFNRSSRLELGPEPENIRGKHIYGHINNNGLFTQALAGEHLAHMIFGQHDLNMRFDQQTYCQNYLPQSTCPGSPCLG